MRHRRDIYRKSQQADAKMYLDNTVESAMNACAASWAADEAVKKHDAMSGHEKREWRNKQKDI